MVEDDDEWIEGRVSAFDALGGRVGTILGQMEAREQAAEEGEEYEGPVWPELPDGLRGLPGDLAVLASFERDDHPMEKVEQRLKSGVPRFLKFDDHAQDLETRYDLNEETPESDRGIHNFLALAGTTWQRARQVSQQDDPGVTKIYQKELDERLEKRTALKWGQSEITVAVSLNPPILSIVVSMQDRDFIGFTDHSDGLKAFVALRAFVARAAADSSDEVRPIVLIDEADRHLHYDAQADLVAVFEEQDEAAQIIYTTHSAGCLPRDLGLGIRAIVPTTTQVEGEILSRTRFHGDSDLPPIKRSRGSGVRRLRGSCCVDPRIRSG